MSWNINSTSKSVTDTKAAVAALSASQAIKAAANADIDRLVASNGPGVLMSANGNGNDSDAPPTKITVTKN
jgi:hypothetical protein